MQKKFLALLFVGVISLLWGCMFITQPLVSPTLSTPPQVHPADLAAHVHFLAETVYPRSADQPEKLDRAEKYIETAFRTTRAKVSLQAVSVDKTPYQNVIAHFGPETGELLVIGAHYDSHGHSTRLGGPYAPQTHTPGADDNASGVAALLALAKLLDENPPSRPVMLVAYTLEEPPYFRTANMGSRVHAASLQTNKQPVQLMLSLEMIGYYSDAPNSQTYPVSGMNLLYPSVGNFVALVGQLKDFGLMRNVKSIMSGATDLPVYSVNAPSTIPGIDFSDHQSYWLEGFPAIMVTDTAFQRNPHYHQAGDTPETLDYERMAKVVQGVYAITQKLTAARP